VTATRAGASSPTYSPNSLVGNGRNETTTSSSRLRRMKTDVARSKNSVMTVCSSHIAPMV
jgi:hypothetical protein